MIRAFTACIVVAMLCTCGPSTRDVALAKLARYRGDKLVLFALIKDVTEKKHALVGSDETILTIQTRGRWFTPEGLASHWQPSDLKGRQDDPLGAQRPLLVDKSLFISMTIKLLPEAEYWIVYIQPKIQRYNIGMPNLEPVDPTHADVPGWATGKVDKLAWEIHRALHSYQVPGLTGSSPTPPPWVPPPDGGQEYEPFDPAQTHVDPLPRLEPPPDAAEP